MKKLIDDALGLLSRCRESEAFRAYLQERQILILAAGIIMLIVALGCAAGVATFLAGLRTWMTLPALVLGSLALAASAAAQLYVFFSWLEGRALAHALHKPLYRQYGIPIGPLPAAPWRLAAGVVGVPLLLLAIAAPVTAIVIALIGAATPVMFARLETELPRPPADDVET